MTSHNFCGIFKELFKVVVVQQKQFKQLKCYINNYRGANFILKLIPTVIIVMLKWFKIISRATRLSQKFPIWRENYES